MVLQFVGQVYAIFCDKKRGIQLFCCGKVISLWLGNLKSSYFVFGCFIFYQDIKRGHFYGGPSGHFYGGVTSDFNFPRSAINNPTESI
jgi:hypothetical protein